MADGVLFEFHADTGETVFPGVGRIPGLVTRELTFATAHHISELLQAMHRLGVEAGLAEALRRVQGHP